MKEAQKIKLIDISEIKQNKNDTTLFFDAKSPLGFGRDFNKKIPEEYSDSYFSEQSYYSESYGSYDQEAEEEEMEADDGDIPPDQTA